MSWETLPDRERGMAACLAPADRRTRMDLSAQVKKTYRLSESCRPRGARTADGADGPTAFPEKRRPGRKGR